MAVAHDDSVHSPSCSNDLISPGSYEAAMKHLFRLGTTPCGSARPRPVNGVVSQRIALPAPQRTGGMPIMEAFANPEEGN